MEAEASGQKMEGQLGRAGIFSSKAVAVKPEPTNPKTSKTKHTCKLGIRKQGSLIRRLGGRSLGCGSGIGTGGGAGGGASGAGGAMVRLMARVVWEERSIA
jgi:hypothetical protein